MAKKAKKKQQKKRELKDGNKMTLEELCDAVESALRGLAIDECSPTIGNIVAELKDDGIKITKGSKRLWSAIRKLALKGKIKITSTCVGTNHSSD